MKKRFSAARRSRGPEPKSNCADIGAAVEDTQLYQEIAERILYSDATLRAPKELLDRNHLGQSALWTQGVSGDLPIVLALIEDDADLELAKQLLKAQTYWQSKCLGADLVLLCSAALYAGVKNLTNGRDQSHGRGAAIALNSDAMPDMTREFLQVAARVLFSGKKGSLRNQLARPAGPVGRPGCAERIAANRSALTRLICCRPWSSSMESAASTRKDANTSLCWTMRSGRRLPG